MSEAEYKHLLARVSNSFYRSVKVQLAEQGLTMRYVIIKGVANELGIEIPPEEMLNGENSENVAEEVI